MKQIINNILHRIKEDSLVKKTSEAKRTKRFHDLKSARTVLVFWVSNDEQDRWLKKIGEIYRDVNIEKLCFVPKEDHSLKTDDVVCVKDEDLGFGGKILNKKLPDILARKYDILIDLTMLPNALIDYILKNSQAACKIGMRRDNFESDIVIDGAEEIDDFLEKLSTILSKLKEY